MGKVINLKEASKPEFLVKLEKEKESEEFKDFVFGDLKIQCSCGNVEPFVKGVEGIRIELPATNKHDLIIVCSRCQAVLRLFYEEAENIEELKKKKDEEQVLKQTVEGIAGTGGIEDAVVVGDEPNEPR